MEISFTPQAYSKMILHSAKYPYSSVNGILLAKLTKGKGIIFEDVIPLFHLGLNLTPMAEVALTQIDEICSKHGFSIAGYYVAHENLRENSLEKAECKITDKIASNCPNACIVVVDNTKLGVYMDNIALKVAQVNDGVYRAVDTNRIVLTDDRTLEICSQLLEEKKYNELNDFDNHLDNIKLDWLNNDLNKDIQSLISQ